MTGTPWIRVRLWHGAAGASVRLHLSRLRAQRRARPFALLSCQMSEAEGHVERGVELGSNRQGGCLSGSLAVVSGLGLPGRGRAPARRPGPGIGAQKQTIAAIVDELETLGYIRRVGDPTDRPAKLIVPTQALRLIAAHQATDSDDEG